MGGVSAEVFVLFADCETLLEDKRGLALTCSEEIKFVVPTGSKITQITPSDFSDARGDLALSPVTPRGPAIWFYYSSTRLLN